MTMNKMLSTYKEQQSVEKGIRFLKSSDFLTNSILIKKPERIEALLMVMTACLMVYATLEHPIRKKLKEKTLSKSNCSLAVSMFSRYRCYLSTPMVVNWKSRQQVIIDCLGENDRQIYS